MMHQRVRCPKCRHWTDALLVWAAGDCCPSCNAPIAGFDRAERGAEREMSEQRRLSHTGLGRWGVRPLDRAGPLER
ncbi:MAG TPA: hypothetical protein VNX67_00085 [Solirubrobacteraceae bacterium]|nr:hypothetical protein [Solirubrobacteraceae bacterium]